MSTVLIVTNQSDGKWADTHWLMQEYRTVRTHPDALDSVSTSDVAAVIIRITPVEKSLATIEDLRKHRPRVPIIVVSREASASAIVATIKSGASNYLVEPIGPEAVHTALQDAFAANLPRPKHGEPIAGPTPGSWSEKAETLIDTVAGTAVPVLLLGETGVGKEVVARRIHERSSRAGRPFLKVNCAALSPELLESELFGYERDAFTGAVRRTPGKFEMADGGTILLDEIGEMDPRLQAKLLQVLQDDEFLRLGSAETIKIDVRVMAATHRNLDEAIAAGTFRDDLYFRLNIIEVYIPPLRQRRNEILTLAEHFLRTHSIPAEPHAPFPEILKKAFLNYSWPGNIRELENIVRRYLVLKDPVAIAEQLAGPGQNRDPRVSASRQQMPFGPVTREIVNLDTLSNAHRVAETETILAALNETRWHRKEAAALLKIDYKALLYKMNKLGIGEDQSQGSAPGGFEKQPPRMRLASASTALGRGKDRKNTAR